MEYTKIFSSIQIGNMTVKNRLVMGPMGTSLANIDNTISDRQIAYYARRAEGGAGMIIIEHAYPQRIGCKSNKSVGMWDKHQISKWKKLTDALHQYGCKAVVEIGHLGRCTDIGEKLGMAAIAPTAIRCRVAQTPVRSATKEDIEQFQTDYLNSVRIALEAGFDSIQLHFTNGYFLASWLSGRTNRRTDRYGGNFENRLTMALELIEKVRGETGKDFPIIARLASREANGGRGVEETRLIAKAFEEAGIDALDINAGSPEEYDWEFPSYYKPQGFLLEDAEKIKRSVKIPVISGGRIVEPRMAEQALLDNRVDMVEVNRGLIADPDWLVKVREGRINEIRRCIACTRCINEKERNGLICSVNSRALREESAKIAKAPEKKNVLVVGGGPAGLQASIIAAERGHKVTLMEKNEFLGGMLIAAAAAPPKWEIVNVVTAMATEAERLGVEIKEGVEAKEEDVKNGGYDAVVRACGAVPWKLKIDGAEEIETPTAVDVLSGAFWPGKNVVIIGGGMVGCECAEYLIPYHKSITIVEIRDGIAADIAPNLREILLTKLQEGGVKIMCSAAVAKITHDSVIVEQNEKKIILEHIDTVIQAVGLKPSGALKQLTAPDDCEMVDIGDCKNVARLHEALTSAVEATLNI